MTKSLLFVSVGMFRERSSLPSLPIIGKKALILSSVLLASACSTLEPMYYWGNYENLLYKMYKTPGDATPGVQIERLSADLQRAEANGKRIPPGVYAHLGMMYMASGNIGQAYAAFNEEKTLYPESATLIDGMIARARKNLRTDTNGGR